MSSDSPWYRDGLCFACTRCGNCCSGEPGTVSVSDEEIERLARHAQLDVDDFREVYTRQMRRGEISLREKRNGECVFYRQGSGCSVYDARPRQCRTWPFWRSVVHSPDRWAEESEDCPGMNRGPLHDADAILRTSERDGTR